MNFLMTVIALATSIGPIYGDGSPDQSSPTVDRPMQVFTISHPKNGQYTPHKTKNDICFAGECITIKDQTFRYETFTDVIGAETLDYKGKVQVFEDHILLDNPRILDPYLVAGVLDGRPVLLKREAYQSWKNNGRVSNGYYSILYLQPTDPEVSLKGGLITGLPATYLPASFDVKAFTLVLAGKKIVIPESLRDILMQDVRADPFDDSPPQMEIVPSTFSFSASWRREDLDVDQTPYMVITITPKAPDCHFHLIIDMANLRLKSATLLINNIGPVPIDLVDKADTRNKKNGEQDGGGNALEPPSHPSAAPTKARATP